MKIQFYTNISESILDKSIVHLVCLYRLICNFVKKNLFFFYNEMIVDHFENVIITDFKFFFFF